MSAGISESFWTADIDGDDYIATAMDLIAMRKWLLMETKCFVKTVGDRTLVWNEEFDSGKLNTANFGYLDAYRNNTVTFDTEDTLNYFGGKVNLKVKNLDGVNYKTPNVLTTSGKMSFNQGYLEVRAKISATPGQWAAIWLTGDKDESMDYKGEIDIMETDSTGYCFKNNVISWKDGTGQQLDENYKSAYNYSENNFNKTEYHIFGFEWTDSEIVYYVDGEEYGRFSIAEIKALPYDGESILSKSYPFAEVFNQFYALRLDNMINSDLLTPDGAMPEFNIDYVRLYQKAGEQLKINGELVEK